VAPKKRQMVFNMEYKKITSTPQAKTCQQFPIAYPENKTLKIPTFPQCANAEGQGKDAETTLC
jgi:hypothetical protein